VSDTSSCHAAPFSHRRPLPINRSPLAYREKAVRLLEDRPDERWWLGMSHFYIAVNHILGGNFDAALAEAAHADAVGKAIGDPRLQTYAGYTVGWAEASRGNHDSAIAACHRSREQAPDLVSRAYASLFLGYAHLEKGDPEQARACLEPVVRELEGFGIPQWHALAVTLTAESWRMLGRLDDAAAFVQRGLEVAAGAAYWYAVGFAHRVVGRTGRFPHWLIRESASQLTCD
jgi:tetratricopeptide (TPR) repeat protein